MGHNKLILILVSVMILTAMPAAVMTGNGTSSPGIGIPDGARQAVVVQAIGHTGAVLSCWEKTDGQWILRMADVDAVLGRSGLIDPEIKEEGDGATPGGVYALRRVFGYAPCYDTKMPYIPLAEWHFWIDDPSHEGYNQLVEGRPSAASYEVMRREDHLYQLGVVIEYNTQPVVAGKGSAIFLHIWRGPGVPTAGCVALSAENLARVVAWLDPQQQPVMILQRQ